MVPIQRAYCTYSAARLAGLGIWAGDQGAGAVIADIRNSGTAEHVILRNNAADHIDLSGWRLPDDDGNTLAIPSGVIVPSNGTVTIHSGSDGVDAPPTRFYPTRQNVWNNGGDSAFLHDADNQRADSFTYP